MQYKVIITDEYIKGCNKYLFNQLTFTFENIEDAKYFASYVLKTSLYSVKIIQLEEKQEEENYCSNRLIKSNG